MASIVKFLWLIPALPLLAAALSALCRRPQKRCSSLLAVVSMLLSFVLACAAFVAAMTRPEEHATFNFDWLKFGDTSLKLGFVLDPLSASMILMVTFVGLLIFIFRRLYGTRRKLHPFLLFPVAVRGRDARPGHFQQFAASLYLLGTGRPRLLSTHRVLVREAK